MWAKRRLASALLRCRPPKLAAKPSNWGGRIAQWRSIADSARAAGDADEEEARHRASYAEKLKALCHAGPLAEAWPKAEQLLRAGHGGDALSFLVGQAAAAGDLPLARRISLRLVAMHVDGAGYPLTGLWMALICAHAQGGDADGAFAMLRHLDRESSGETAEVPAVVVEALISGLIEKRRYAAAFAIFQRFRTRSLLEPSLQMYVLLLRCCRFTSDADRAVELFEELAAREQPPAEARAEFIAVLAGRRQTVRRAFQVFGESSRAGHLLSLDMCRPLAAACGRYGLSEEAKLLHRRLLAAGLEPDVRMRADIVRAFGSAAARASQLRGPDSNGECVRLLGHAWQIAQEACRSGPLHADIFNALVSAYCGAGLTEHACQLLDMSEELGCSPDAASYAAILAAVERAPQDFQQLWGRMTSAGGVQPTPAMLELALRVAVASRSPQWVCTVLEQMFAACVAPSEHTVHSIRGLSAGPEGRRLRNLLDAFERTRFPPKPTAAGGRTIRRTA